MDAAPVVLVHGLGTTADRTWRDNGWIDLLTDAGRTVSAPDLLGHGRSPAPHDPAAYDALEDHLADQLPEGPIDAVGFSLGARTLLVVASRQPERFRHLVLAGVGANLFRHDDPAPLAAAFDGSAEAPAWATYFVRQAEACGNDPLALAALLRRPSATELTDEALARVVCPVLVVLGTEDFAGPADPLLERLPDARLATLTGIDHFATPKSFGFIDAALGFLER